MSAHTPSILLVEDHALLGRLLARFLQERADMQIWALVETAEAALEQLAALPAHGNPEVQRPDHPDLVLIDVSLPGMSGIEMVGLLARLYPELPCLMLSAHSNPAHVRQALDNGARGYVAKGDPPVIIEAVAQVLAGEIYLSDAIRLAMDA